jgi:hypothetical protein
MSTSPDKSDPSNRADQPIHIWITGLAPNDRVNVASQADDYRKRQWYAQATFTADSHGVIDLDRSPPTARSYSGVDGTGLFWVRYTRISGVTRTTRRR